MRSESRWRCGSARHSLRSRRDWEFQGKRRSTVRGEARFAMVLRIEDDQGIGSGGWHCERETPQRVAIEDSHEGSAGQGPDAETDVPATLRARSATAPCPETALATAVLLPDPAVTPRPRLAVANPRPPESRKRPQRCPLSRPRLREAPESRPRDREGGRRRIHHDGRRARTAPAPHIP